MGRAADAIFGMGSGPKKKNNLVNSLQLIFLGFTKHLTLILGDSESSWCLVLLNRKKVDRHVTVRKILMTTEFTKNVSCSVSTQQTGCLYFSLSAAALNRIKLTKIEILVNSLH